MEENKEDLLARTVDFWQQRTSRGLSEEDARQIAESVAGFFKTLMEWDRASHGARHEATQDQPPGPEAG